MVKHFLVSSKCPFSFVAIFFILIMQSLTLITGGPAAVKGKPAEVVSGRPVGIVLDVYSQRGGEGLNESSDAFAPQELMVVTAYLTYNVTPIADKLVTFQLYLPNGTLVWCRNATTDHNGSASIDYHIPSMPVFGLYSINASASVAGETVSDTLWFRVGWLVEVLEVVPCDRNGVPKSQFEKGEPLYLRVKLQNIRLHSTNATLVANIYDEGNVPIIFHTEEHIIPPNQTNILLNPGQIPEWAYVGKATAHVGALQWPGGPPYCPEVSAWFMITPPIPDVAVVGVTTSSFEIYSGQSVNITVSVLNEYYEPQSFNVTIYANTTVIQTLTIADLTPYIPTNFTFIWDTYAVSRGNYIISAQASTVPGEIDTTDNTYINGIVTILIRDVTVTDITSSATEAYPTWTVPMKINVTITNKGDLAESFPVTLYWNNTNVIDTKTVTLNPQETKTLTYTWTIPTIPFAWPYPTYTLKANATLPGDNNPSDNTRTDGTITIKWPGDIDGDGHINVHDLFWFAESWGRRIGDPRYDPRMDFDGDGRILTMDLFILAKSWYKGPLD